MDHDISLTQAEWEVMECLWEESPLTGREVTQHMQQRCGWSRSTTLTLLGRLEAKGAVKSTAEEIGPKVFSPPWLSWESEPDGQRIDPKTGSVPTGTGRALRAPERIGGGAP